jgi:hypothetical protein
MTTRTQNGSLKQIAGSGKISRAKIEYKSPVMPWIPSDTGRGGMDITNIIPEDGQSYADGDYEFTVEDDDGFYTRGTRIRFRNDGGRWSVLP